MSSLNQLHVDQALTDVSIAYKNPAFVAEEVFPVVPVRKKNDVFFKFSKQHFRAYKDAYRAGQRAQQIEVDLDSRGFYMADGHALDVTIDDDEREQADPGAQLEIEKTEKCTEVIKLNQENKLFSEILTTGNITQNVTLSGPDQWSDFDNSDPVTEVLTRKQTIQQQIGVMPTTLLISRPVFDKLRNHRVILERIKYTGQGAWAQLSAQALAEVFELERVLVSEALKQSVPEGRADALAYMMSKDALLFYRPARPGLRVPAFGYTFFWASRSGVKRWREEGIEADFLRVKKYYDMRIVAANAAFLWKNAVA